MLKLYKKSVKIITNTGMTRNNNFMREDDENVIVGRDYDDVIWIGG